VQRLSPTSSVSDYNTSSSGTSTTNVVNDRQCRQIVLTTIATIARPLYTYLRPSPLLYSFYEPTCHHYEDEIGSDLPAILCTIALEDVDETISATAISTLGQLIDIGSNTTFGGLYDDDLNVHVRYLMGDTSPYRPTVRSIADEDIGIPIQELAIRIMEHTLSPRLLQLLDRIVRYQQKHNVAMVLPCISLCLVHLLDVYPTTIHHTDRTTYSKRWSELDVVGSIDVCVTGIILPILQGTRTVYSPMIAMTAATCGLRLAYAVPGRHWVKQICYDAVTVSQEVYQSSMNAPIETRLSLLSIIIVAARAITMYPDRTNVLIWFGEQLCSPTIPTTMTTPVPGAGVRFITTNRTETLNTTASSTNVIYRRPTRMALWTEVALSFFMDGPAHTTSAPSSQQQHAKRRHECLSDFLNSPTLQDIRTVPSNSPIVVSSQQQLLRDEMLLAFTAVAIESGRRLRVAPDGHTSLGAPDLNCDIVPEWIALTNVVLSSFADCALVPVVSTGSTSAYLDETLTLLNAGLASYVQLLQEYLHFVGLLYPSTSVALKLGANACPPHLLWDRLTESASFLSHIEPMIVESDSGHNEIIKTSTKLMTDLVIREYKTGIPSHHMRLFVLALASDHWVQCRIVAIRKEQLESMNGTESPGNMSNALDVANGREILMALAPKRLLLKIIQAHVPPVGVDGKPKRDPMKKLALESTRVCVACIENIALLACDWRRRFGSTSESKNLVSIAVGLLQGKMDETTIDESMKSMVGPTCDAAVSRIQSFYESSGANGPSMDSFPLSELVMQPVKIKIKPLVSASKPNVRPKDETLREYMMQLIRQIVASRIQLAVFSNPHAGDSLFTAARPMNWLRLSVPPIPPSRDGRIYGGRGATLSAWDHSVMAASAASDPIQLIVAYTVRRYLRCDGEDDYQITVLVRAFNMTPIDIVEGIRLEIGIMKTSATILDGRTSVQVTALGYEIQDLDSDVPLSCISAEYLQEIKSGEFVTWEVTLNDISSSNSLRIIPSIVYLNVPVEPEDSGIKMVGASDGETSTVNKGSRNGEDDFQVTRSDVGASNAFQGGAANVRLVGESLTLPPLIVCQPCTLVFFTDRRGDIDSFRFLWFRFPHHLAPIRIVARPLTSNTRQINPITQKIAEMSSLDWEGEAIPGGVAVKLWAFVTLSGDRIYCILTESDGPNSDVQRTLYIRGDNPQLLFSFVGSNESRQSVVSSLLPNMIPME
jgi:hypothetical protein